MTKTKTSVCFRPCSNTRSVVDPRVGPGAGPWGMDKSSWHRGTDKHHARRRIIMKGQPDMEPHTVPRVADAGRQSNALFPPHTPQHNNNASPQKPQKSNSVPRGRGVLDWNIPNFNIFLIRNIPKIIQYSFITSAINSLNVHQHWQRVNIPIPTARPKDADRSGKDPHEGSRSAGT